MVDNNKSFHHVGKVPEVVLKKIFWDASRKKFV